MSIGTDLNNWLNIRYLSGNKWKGQIGEYKGFVLFDTVEHGLRAWRIIMEHYLARGQNTVEKIIEAYAPSSENDTEAYIENIVKWTGFERDAVIDSEDLSHLVLAMCRMETGTTPTAAQIVAMWG